AARDPSAAEHRRQVERFGLRAELGDVDLDELQALQRPAGARALACRIEHRLRYIDGGHPHPEALDQLEGELSAAAAQVERRAIRIEGQQIENALDLRCRDRIAISVIAMRDR